MSILRAAGWSISGYVGVQFLRICSNLVLTRLLVPEMFGLMAVATTVHVAVAMFSDVGIRQAAIQSQMGNRQEYLDTAWTLQFIHGISIWIACLAISYGVAMADAFHLFPAGSVYAEPVLPAVIAVTCFSSVLAGLQSTKVITAYRELSLGRLTAIELSVQCVSLGVAVTLAWQTKSVWSFVIAALCSSALTTILSFLWLPGRGNRFRLERFAARDLVRFGKWVLLSSAFTVLAASGDRILLAGWISPAMFGLYILAFSLVSIFEGAGGRLFYSVAIPALSKVAREGPERLAAVFTRMRLPFDLVFIALAGVIYASGDVVVSILYDPRYEPAGKMLEILSFGLLFSRFGVLSNVYLAMGKPRILSLLNLVRGVAVFVLVPMSYLLFGMEGAIWAIAFHGLPSALLLIFVHMRHQLGNLKLELLVFSAWPFGFAIGHLVDWIFIKVSLLV